MRRFRLLSYQPKYYLNRSKKMTEREILQKLIQDGKDAEAKLEALEVTYSIGDRFRTVSGTKCILVVCGGGFVVMIDLRNGSCWGVGKTKVKDAYSITSEEFSKISATTFYRYWDNRKQVNV